MKKKQTATVRMLEPHTAARLQRITAAAGQEYAQINEVVYLGGNAIEHAELTVETKHHIRLAIEGFRKHRKEGALTATRDQSSEPEELETVLYASATSSPNADHYLQYAIYQPTNQQPMNPSSVLNQVRKMPFSAFFRLSFLSPAILKYLVCRFVFCFFQRLS